LVQVLWTTKGQLKNAIIESPGPSHTNHRQIPGLLSSENTVKVVTIETYIKSTTIQIETLSRLSGTLSSRINASVIVIE